MTCGGGEPDYYEVLMVPEGATEEQIRAQYRRLAAVLHPDANPQRRDLAEERMKLLNEARDVLLDPARRAEYDARRRAAREAAGEEGRPEGRAGREEGAPADFGSEPGSGVVERGEGMVGASRAAGRGWARLRLPLTGVRGAAGYFLASRATYRILSGRVQPWVWALALPLLIADIVHAVVTFFLLSWWLGESPLATYPVALAVLSQLTYFTGLWERGAGWAILAALGAGAVARVSTLGQYRASLGEGKRTRVA